MQHLIIGGKGLVGSAFISHLNTLGVNYFHTNREWFDLKFCSVELLPKATEYVYLIAAMNGFQKATHPDAWRVNVDAPIKIARHFKNRVIVFISSDAVEWSNEPYARQKATVESYLRTLDRSIIIRPSRITPETVNQFVKFMFDAVHVKEFGVLRWQPKGYVDGRHLHDQTERPGIDTRGKL